MAETLWHVSFRTGWPEYDDVEQFVAIGEDRDWMPLYRVEGSLLDADGLRPLDALFPSCLRFMLDADPVDDMAQLT